MASLVDDESTSPVSEAGYSIQACADGALNAFRSLAGMDVLTGLKGSQLLSERAKILNLNNPGRISANGSCRLIQTTSCWIALNLARDEDWELMPAWLADQGTELTAWSWLEIESVLGSSCGFELVDRGRLMGLPVTVFNSHQATKWHTIPIQALPGGRRRSSPVVVDLSSLWAGPLCSHLLELTGATVIKVESVNRSDTTRSVTPDFFNLLNAGKKSVTVDLRNPHGIRQLKHLLEQADIVIESTRPRALQQLGVDAEVMAEQIPGLIWLSITGYGRSEPQANFVAFGDDAAVAAGAAIVNDREASFIGDALSDPLTGLHSAIIATSMWQADIGGLVDISLAGVTAFIMQFIEEVSPIDLAADASPRKAPMPARRLGADNDDILDHPLS